MRKHAILSALFLTLAVALAGPAPPRGELMFDEGHSIRVFVDEPDALPLVGKQFVVGMLPDEGGGGTFDCEIADRVPEDFQPDMAVPMLTAHFARTTEIPVQVEWWNADGEAAPLFTLTEVPRSAPKYPTGTSPGAEAVFRYQGRAPVDVPDWFTSTCTVTPSDIRVGARTRVEVALTVALRHPPSTAKGINYDLVIPTEVPRGTIQIGDLTEPTVLRSVGPSCIEGKPYTVVGYVPPEDLPKTVRFNLRVLATRPGALRLVRAVYASQGFPGKALLPEATATSPQATSVRHFISSGITRVHTISINAKP